MRIRSFDLNILLSLANVAVIGALVFAFSRVAGHPYIDEQTVALGIVLCLQTQLALLIERRRRDPLMLLLAFQLTFYYALRIFTLSLYPVSDVFDRYAYDPADSNRALSFMLIANLFLYGGFFAAGRCDPEPIAVAGWRATAPGRVVALLVFAIVFAYFSGRYWESVPRGLTFLAVFLTPTVIVAMVLTYYFLFRRTLGKGFAIAIAVLVIGELVAHTLVGSRSAIVAIIQSCIIVLLAIRGSIKFSNRFVLLGLVSLPVVAVLLVAAFAISTYNRANREVGVTIDLGQALKTASEGAADLPLRSGLDVLLPPIFSRAGFFDLSAEVIAHSDQYALVINPDTYAKSIIDNLLTPGFDLFDQPKVANALQFTYRYWGTPSKREVSESYQSDQVGIYGEFYVLFGYAAFPALFAVAYLLKRVYLRLRSANPFMLAMKRIIVLTVLIRVIDSFGMDWVIFETVPLIVATVLFSYVFAARPPRPAAPDGAAVLPTCAAS
jgi:hypothetical protein